MKEKFRNAVVMEGPDLMLGGIIFTLLINIFFKKYVDYIPIFVVIAGIGLICFIFSFFYCLIHLIKNKEFSEGKKVIKGILLFLFGLFYIPIYYTKYVMKKKKWLGVVECIVFILGYVFLIFLFGLLLMDSENEVKYSKDAVIKANIPASWFCYDDNIGDQKLFCLNIVKQSSFGIFTYEDSSGDIDLLKYHSEQLNKGYLQEGYKVVSYESNDNNYITKLTKDKEELFTIAGVKKYDNTSVVIVYTGVEKSSYLNIYDNVEYNGFDE